MSASDVVASCWNQETWVAPTVRERSSQWSLATMPECRTARRGPARRGCGRLPAMEPRIATADDAAEVGDIMANGFLADPVMRWVYEEERRLDKLRAMFTFLAAEADIPLGATWISDGATAAWTPPGTPDWPNERGVRFFDTVGRLAGGGELARLGQMDDACRAVHPQEPHWYLGIIAARPERTGEGLGSALMKASLARVDDEGLPAYLESSNPRNVTLYLRHGFEIIGEIRLPDGGPSLTPMLRPPSA